MEESRTARLTALRFQVRSLKQRERKLLVLHDKPCDGNRAEAAAELAKVRRHIQDAEIALADALRESGTHLFGRQGLQHTSLSREQ